MRGVSLLAQASGSEPAGGAAAVEAIGGTVGALVVTALIAVVIAAHRSGRIGWLARLSSFVERQSGLPAWAALPSAVMGVSLLTAALGMYWDISLHIDNGRDDGPPAEGLDLFANYAGGGPDLTAWTRDAIVNRDRNLKLQYLAGLGLNLYQSDRIYADMLTHARYPEGLFVGSQATLAALREGIARQQGRGLAP